MHLKKKKCYWPRHAHSTKTFWRCTVYICTLHMYVYTSKCACVPVPFIFVWIYIYSNSCVMLFQQTKHLFKTTTSLLHPWRSNLRRGEFCRPWEGRRNVFVFSSSTNITNDHLWIFTIPTCVMDSLHIQTCVFIGCLKKTGPPYFDSHSSEPRP